MLGHLAYSTQQAFSDEAHCLLDKRAHLVDQKCVPTLKLTSVCQFIQD